ncbi:MAG: hypothetical protein M0R80_01330 [Proteobacteria bacterium]|jgi:hypothetical protein|nr:hypothetical protein [Pseudomonadota bacterium]
MDNPTTFLSWLQHELDSIGPEDFNDPVAEVDPSDIEIGVANDEAKKMYTLRDLCHRNADELMLSAKYERDKEKAICLCHKAGNYKTMANLWDGMLWQAIYKQYPEAVNKARVGIRKGFMVVASDKSAEPNDMLRQLFGGLFGGFSPG